MNCKLYWKPTTWDVLGPMSVQIRKNGKLLALKRKRKKPKQGKNPEKNENEDAVNHLNDNDSSLQAPRQSTSNSAQSTDQKPCVIFAGDSMLKFINSRKLSSQISNQGLTYVKAFPGATVEDMSDYIMPSLRRRSYRSSWHEQPQVLRATRNCWRYRQPGIKDTKSLPGLQDYYFIVNFKIRPNS